MFKELLLPFLLARKGSVQRCTRDIGNNCFWSTCPVGIKSMTISRCHSIEICVSSYPKEFGRLEAIASLDAYRITKFQILQNIFLCYYLIFEEFEKEFLSQNFLLVAWAGVINRFI